MPIELNLLGLDLHRKGKDRGYPCEQFWTQAKQYRNQIVLGVDAHAPSALSDTTLWDDGIAYLQKHELSWLQEPDVTSILK